MNDMIGRLSQFIERLNISTRQFEGKISASNGLIRKAIASRTDIQSKWLVRIAENFPQLNTEWLLTGQGEMFKSESALPAAVPPPIILQTEMPTLGDHTAVPVVEIEAAAGFGAPNAEYMDKSQMIYLPKGMLRGRADRLCIKVTGDSMSPTLYNNSRVVVRRLHESEWEHLRNREIYVVTNREGNTFIKRIENKLHQDGTLILLSDNADQRLYKPISLPEEEIFVIWAVELFLVRTLGEPSDPIGLANEMQTMKKQISDLSTTVGRLVQKVNKES